MAAKVLYAGLLIAVLGELLYTNQLAKSYSTDCHLCKIIIIKPIIQAINTTPNQKTSRGTYNYSLYIIFTKGRAIRDGLAVEPMSRNPGGPGFDSSSRQPQVVAHQH